MGNALNSSQVFQLQTHESVRAYVRELAGWDGAAAKEALLVALELIDRAKHDPELAGNLLAAEPTDLDALIDGTPVEPGSVE